MDDIGLKLMKLQNQVNLLQQRWIGNVEDKVDGLKLIVGLNSLAIIVLAITLITLNL